VVSEAICRNNKTASLNETEAFYVHDFELRHPRCVCNIRYG